MLETKEQKQIFFGCIALVLVLVAFSIWNRQTTAPVVQNTNNSDDQLFSSKAYLDYFAAANVDREASKELMQTILTAEDIKAEVEKDLKVDQTISAPIVDDSKLKIAAKTTEENLNTYLSNSITEAYNFSTGFVSQSTNLFSADLSAASKVEPEVLGLTEKLYAMEVPKEAEAMHKSLIQSYLAYEDLIKVSKNFKTDFQDNSEVWPEVYKNYVIINDSTKAYADELNKVATKYSIAYVNINVKYADEPDTRPMALKIAVPRAQAIFGLTWSFTLGDIPRIIMDGVKEGVRSAFLQFMGAMLNKLVTKIEQNYAISNFLYYSDALINGQYVNDYLNKYVNDPLDRIIVTKLVPQFNCGANPNLKDLYKAQAIQYLGFNPATLDINDPDYYAKMARSGEYMASPSGWQQYYEGLAAKAETEAQKAAEQELTSPGLKTPRTAIKSTISNSINSIISAERASLTATLQLGINNAESIISGVVAQLTQTLINRFVFQGVTGEGGNIAVFKEQSVCVSTPVISPVLPVPPTQYKEPPAPPTAQAAVAQQCAQFSSTNADCTDAIMAELQICANNPSQHTGNMTCNEMSNSPYINALLQECNALIRKTQTCLSLQELLSRVP